MSVALIDFGAGNLHSVHNALKAAGADDVRVTADAAEVGNSDRIVLPGVGAFGACRDALFAIPDMVETLDRRVRTDGVPFLGICVGMQLLADEGIEFGRHAGLGWISGSVAAIRTDDPAIKIPHMGWNSVEPQKDHALVAEGEAYFLHGYHFAAGQPADVIATTDHGGALVAAVGRDNILGVQFHPEKSQAYGIAMLTEFLEWQP